MKHRLISDGTAQEDRLLPGLQAAYFHVDELRFEDLLAFSARYATLLKFFDQRNEHTGDWRGLFRSDELCILADILSTRTDWADAQFQDFLSHHSAHLTRIQQGEAGLESLPSYQLANKMDTWLSSLVALPHYHPESGKDYLIQILKKSLNKALQALYDFLAQRVPEQAESAFQSFHPFWALNLTPPAPTTTQDSRRFWLQNFSAFLNSLQLLQQAAHNYLQKSLARNDHEPALALLLAFLRLFAKVQTQLNSFGAKHLDFYYSRVLQVPHRPSTPDSAYLVLGTDVPGREVLIRKGTLFQAGQDENGKDLRYASDEERLITDAHVCQLYTLNIQRDPLSSPENELKAPKGDGGGRKRFASGMVLRTLAVAEQANSEQAWPLFGGGKRDEGPQQFQVARMGFAIASGVLRMKHGLREITVNIQFATNAGLDLPSFTRHLAGVLHTSEEDAFRKAFRDMFSIYLSAEDGWYAVSDYLVASGSSPQGRPHSDLSIQIRIPEQVAAIVAYSEAIHGPGFATHQPVMQLVLNPDAYLYGYSLLSQVVVRQIHVHVRVLGCTELSLSNQLGMLNAESQFQAFGPMPNHGDYLVIACPEAARKRLTDFEIELEWGGLPYGVDDFAEYYRGYPMRVSNESFRVQLAALRNRKWLPQKEDEQLEAPLFETLTLEDGSTCLGPSARISLRKIAKHCGMVQDHSGKPLNYGPHCKDGFFRLRISNPPQAFGHRDYPSVMSKAMTEDAKRQRFSVRKLLGKSSTSTPLPNPPYTPLVNAMRVNYAASSSLRLEHVANSEHSQDQLFHLYPLGIEKLASSAKAQQLIPRLDADGHLLIGITASRISGPLSLFFHLRDDSLQEASTQPFKFTWHYLAANHWQPLAPERILSDSTQGFLLSGIIVLDLPTDIDQSNTILPSECYWLKVATNDPRRGALCSLYGVYAQALKVTWQPQEGNSQQHLAQALAAGQISELSTAQAGIASIQQIQPSWGGSAPESHEHWITRTSERLRHKQRACTPWDYEHLVLEAFPDIYKAKCIPGPGGHVVIALIPKPKESVLVNPRPMVSAYLLKEIRHYLQRLASPFVKIEVINPSYEHIQVRCRIKLRAEYNDGRTLNRINQALFDYLSPWDQASRRLGFGWCLRCDEVQSYLLSLDEVDAVSGLALLHIWEEELGYFYLTDTAAQEAQDVHPTRPWSLAIPMAQHLIEAVADTEPNNLSPTGIADLSIGSTFILS